MTDVKTKRDSNKAISVQYTLVNEEKSHLEFIEQALAAKRGFLKINSGQRNVFIFFFNSVLFMQVYFFKLLDIFVQFVKYIFPICQICPKCTILKESPKVDDTHKSTISISRMVEILEIPRKSLESQEYVDFVCQIFLSRGFSQFDLYQNTDICQFF